MCANDGGAPLSVGTILCHLARGVSKLSVHRASTDTTLSPSIATTLWVVMRQIECRKLEDMCPGDEGVGEETIQFLPNLELRLPPEGVEENEQKAKSASPGVADADGWRWDIVCRHHDLIMPNPLNNFDSSRLHGMTKPVMLDISQASENELKSMISSCNIGLVETTMGEKGVGDMYQVRVLLGDLLEEGDYVSLYVIQDGLRRWWMINPTKVASLLASCDEDVSPEDKLFDQ